MEEIHQELFDGSTSGKSLKEAGIDFDQKLNVFSGRLNDCEISGFSFGIKNKEQLFTVFDDFYPVSYPKINGIEVYGSFVNSLIIKNEVALGKISSDTLAIEAIKETLEFGSYKKIYNALYLSCYFKTRLSNQPKPFTPYINNKSFGYKDYVRGYEQYVIDGYAFMLAKLNIKYALLHQYRLKLPFKINKSHYHVPAGVYLNFYADWGKVFNTTLSSITYNNTLTNTDLVGYGTGLDLVFFNDKILRIEYSYTILGFKNFNLHFGKAF